MAKNDFVVIDRGWNKLQKEASKLAGGVASSVGVQGTKAGQTSVEHGSMTNAELGAIQEFGTRDKKVPERSHIRSTFDENQPKYQMELDKIASGFFGNEPVEGSLVLLGEKYRKDIIQKIQSGQLKELADSTKEGRKRQQKGRSAEMIPLLVSGQYVNSISSVIVDRRSKEGES